MDGPRVRVGTSGWTYADWRGPVYPPEVPDRRRLEYYAEGLLDTVERGREPLPLAALLQQRHARVCRRRRDRAAVGPRRVTEGISPGPGRLLTG
ncbi:hypothetical protein BN12_940004 [Nostocoides japonicum T1-X7]|uniref:DUF72 domain-containing protein n=1 Tax=Nostocoides japonicum T1-X7 TaxID=1194083 RepID=A0A077M3P5_9MICO|nr:hypothetical protein BN12_940004 [Tetrasphaera japonica T1-X7]